MRALKVIRAEDVEEFVELDAATGKLTWKPRRPDQFNSKKPDAMCRTWNARFAGKPALSTEDEAGYCRGYIKRKMTLAHRVVFALTHGICDCEVDHIDGNPRNNKPSNLRRATPLTNNRNLARPKNNTTGIVGVYRETGGLWRAAISVNNKQVFLGRFKSKGEAARARKAAERRFGFHPNHGRAA